MKLPKATGATLSDVLVSADYKTAFGCQSEITVDELKDDMTNPYGLTCQVAYCHGFWANGNKGQAKAYGFIKGDDWWIMTVVLTESWGYGPVDYVKPDEMFNTWKWD